MRKTSAAEIYRMNLLRIFLSSLNYILLAVLLCQVVFLYTIGPRYKIRRLDLDANVYIPDEMLLEVLEISGNTYLFQAREEEMERELENLPQVKKAQVVREFPSTLRVFLQGSRTLLQALVRDGSRQMAVCFDNQGVVMSRGRDSFDNVPVLSGLEFESFEPGARVSEDIRSLFHNLDKIRQTSPFIYDLISEIEIRPENETYNLVLFFSFLPVPVILGHDVELPQLKKVMIVLDALKLSRDWQNIKEVDFRTDQVVYKLRKDQG